MAEQRARTGVLPLLCLSAVVVLVVGGLARGVEPGNLHNGLLGLSFALVGTYVLAQRPGHRLGGLLLTTGVVEAVMFAGRQRGLTDAGAQWAGWLGVWPLTVGLGLTTLSVLLLPDGRLPSPRWRLPAVLVVVVCTALAAASALWPVGYAAAGVLSPHPLSVPGGGAAQAVWDVAARPAFAALQLLWVVALVARWRRASGHVRRQLALVGVAAAVSVAALATGLAVAGTPLPGLLAATLVPVAAGVAVAHGQRLAAHAALTWLSRTGDDDRPAALARAAAEAVGARAGVLWSGTPDALRTAGCWPGDEVAPTTLDDLQRDGRVVRVVVRDGTPVGALSVDPQQVLAPAEHRLLDDLAAQAVLVLEQALTAPRTRLGRLSPREDEVLALMADGLSNAAIAQRLHLSLKTVEPLVSSVFAKLDLQASAGSNRRVLAVRAYLER